MTSRVLNGAFYNFEQAIMLGLFTEKAQYITKSLEEGQFYYSFSKTWILDRISRSEVAEILSNHCTRNEVINDEDHSFYIVYHNFVARILLSKSGFENELWCHFYCRIGEERIVEKEVRGWFSEYIKTGLCKMSVSWNYCSAKGELEGVRVTDIISDQVHQEAYPYIKLEPFISNYLHSKSSILILIGPQGTGKTKLIRHIMRFYQNAYGEDADVLYTCDLNAIEKDELYINFRKGDFDFLVLEDIDNQLVSRVEGNNVMHKFLASSDGFLASQKKIILSTNLNVKEIDPALIRSGRCYSVVNMRVLTLDEAQNLYYKLTNEKHSDWEKKSYSVADVYNLAYNHSVGDLSVIHNEIGFSR